MSHGSLSLDLRMEQFDCGGDSSSVSVRWERWKRAFKIYLEASGTDQSEKKKAALLHFGGQDLQEVFYNLPGTDARDVDVYDSALSKLDAYFAPKQCTLYERHIFRLIKQQPDEKFEKFVLQLRRQADKCEFKDKNEHIVDQIIEKCSSNGLRRKILKSGDIMTLDKILAEANALEAVDRQMEDFGKDKHAEQSVNKINTREGKTWTNQRGRCGRCGNSRHSSNSETCPARNKDCLKCGLRGHYRNWCKTKINLKRKVEESFDKNKWKRTKNERKHMTEVNQITEQKEKDKEKEMNYVFHIDEDLEVECLVGGVKIKMIIDSGCKHNLITGETWEVMKKQQVVAYNQNAKPDVKFTAYGSNKPLKVRGCFDTTLKVGGKQEQATFYVISDGTRNLLGKQTAIATGILKIGLDSAVNKVEQEDEMTFPKFKDVLIEVQIDESIPAVSQPYRRIPIPLEEKVEAKLTELVSKDIIEAVPGSSKWVSPIVPILKDNGEVRLCVDMRRANEAILRENHPLPTMDQLLPRMREAKYFTKLDIKDAFHQIELHPSSRHITTFITGKGLFRYKRLMFGISCAPEIFQKVLERILLGCEGVFNFIDDILVYGKDQKEHDERLTKVLKVLKENDVVLREDKCLYRVDKVNFLGHNLSGTGIRPLQKYISAVQEFRPPVSLGELQSFLGLVNYVGKWIPNLATITEPLKELLRNNKRKSSDIRTMWGRSQEDAFNQLKTALTKVSNLGYYNVKDRTIVIADASPVGLGAILIQVDHRGPRVIAYGHKTLTGCERKYCQTEKEALALVWSVEHFNIFLYGKEFELVTDHKPLEVIFGAKSKPCARIERWILRLQSYRYKVFYQPGKTNIADPISRLFKLPDTVPDLKENYIHQIVEYVRPIAVSMKEIINSSMTDKEIQSVKEGVFNNNWNEEVKPYQLFQNELCFYEGILLRGTRIVIPKELRGRVLHAAHEGHPGIVAMKARMRTKVWWPKCDKDAEKLVKACKGCTLVSTPNPPNPIKRRELPEAAWMDVAIDLMGPLPSGDYLLVVVDYFSRYKEVKICRKITSADIIEVLTEMFSRLGNPLTMTADNGKQFSSQEFRSFCKERNINLFNTVPYWPQQNGEVERQNRDILKRLKISQVEDKDWKGSLLKYLAMYNSTPHSVTGKTPAELFFKRKFRDKIPMSGDIGFEPDNTDSEVRDKDKEMKEKGKEYTDRKRKARECDLEPGDKVYIKNMNKVNKLSLNFEPTTHTVEKAVGGDVQVTSPVLVVELNLNRLEGTQLRALGLLTVFGFNVTYAVRGPTEAGGAPSCSAIECRLLGHCYARHDYKEFYCACFEGYSGADCGVGPLCPRTNLCKNAGACRQMGPAAVSCLCERGFTGDFCESTVAAPECGIEECSEGCKEGRNCDCNPKDSDFTSARFETRLQIVDQAENDISQEIVKQITSYLTASNITLEDEIEILNISSPESNGARTVWLRVWGARREAGALRAALARLAAMRARTDRLRLLPATLHFDMQPALTLHTLIMNQRPEVWEGSEFILSCMAYGSPDIVFAWYKDGIKVNFNGTTRDIWTRTVAEDALGRRMSVLGISEAKRPDSGRWSCSADDAGRKRCKALKLAVLRPPDIRLVPSALTVNKGDNVSITCLAVAGRMHGVLGFSWAREKTLLPMAPGKEVWEDLYPAGSVLKLYNVQKSGQYHCQVSSVAGTNSKGVTMWVLGPTDEACQAEPSHGLRWPKTAPGAHASAACPPGHSGETTRFCEPKTSQREVKWRLPDFSACVADSLKDIFEQFSRISYGYSWGNVTDVSHQYGAVLRSLPSHPGAGTIPLQHSRKMLYYLLSAAGKPRDRIESVPHLLKIYDTLLKHPDTFLDEEKIYELQNAIADAAGMQDNLDLHLHQFSVKSKPVRDDNAAHFKMQAIPTGTEEWLLTSVGVELVGRNGNASVIAVQYHNLAARLPSLGRSIEFNESSSRSGREMEFLVASPQAQMWAAGAGVDRALPHTVTLLFTHVHNYSAVASKLACGVRTQAEPRAWSTKACEVRVPEPTHVACRCRGLGTYALFTIARSTLTDAEKDLRGVVKITVGLGGAMCLAAAALQFLGLVVGRKTRLPVLLKAATAGSHSAALLTLLECDTRQEEACPGALGWVCAACWCAGCAALCAQPLLLQAELAGRTQRAPSVGLLAGVCTLAWLTARLWGGAPLQLGAAAQAVCAAGCALLALLCAALALCAALRLRTITHKVPAERRNYLADRTRVVRHTLALLLTTSAAQAAGVAYAQPGERRVAHVAALSAAALANGLAMLVCYVIRDEECLRSAKRALSLGEPREWQDSPQGDTSLSLYIKQGGEVESRGGVLLDSPAPASPASYWRAPAPLDTPDRLHRRQSTPDSRADIVRCVEYKDSVLSPHRYEHHARPVCDLIPRQPEYMARVRLELGVLNTPPPRQATPLLTCSIDFEPYTHKRFDTAKENCTLCVQSNPDVSKIPSPPIKSCLKKSNKNQEFASSISLPSMEILKDEPKSKSDIEQVNREWNKAYDSPETDRMLNKISNDLDFLLNRTQDANVNVILDQIEEAPT